MAGLRNWPDALELLEFFGVEPEHLSKYGEEPGYEPVRYTVERGSVSLAVQFDELEAIITIELRVADKLLQTMVLNHTVETVKIDSSVAQANLIIKCGGQVELTVSVDPDIRVLLTSDVMA